MGIALWTREQTEPLIHLMDQDMPAFFHAERSLRLGRQLVLSDGKDCALIQDSPSDPMWIWTSRSIPNETLEDIVFSLSALREEENLNAVVAKNQLARLLSLAFESETEKRQRILVYTMDSLRPAKADGKCVSGAEVDPEFAGELIAMMVRGDGEELSHARRNGMGVSFSQSPDSFAWRTDNKEIAAIARTAAIGSRYTEIHTVITRPEMRNHGYAQALLTVICEKILEKGKIPMLYADSDYLPSNAAYRKIGFSVKDRLTAIRFRKK